MTPRVLVVEDNRDLAEDVQELFEETGATVEVRTDAASAEQAARSEAFDLALIDVNLPAGANGLDLVPSLRERSPGGEVIVITGSATLGSAIEAVRQGVFAYVPKPFDPTDLLRLSERALTQVRLREERAALSRELARSEALHRAVFDSVESLIVGLDADGHIAMWNRAAEALTGWRLRDVRGEGPCKRLLDAADCDRFAALVAAADPNNEEELVTNTESGAQKVVRWTALPLQGGYGSGVTTILSGTDLTEQLALGRRAADAEAMAALGRMTSSLAHEIRNPLNAATLQLELLKRGVRKLGDDKLERRAVVVADELKRLSSLLDDFLGLARPTNVTLTEVDANEVVRDIAALHEPLATDHGLGFEVDVPEQASRVRADAGRLKQAMTNLVVNAIDALQAQGHGAVRLAVEVPSSDELLLVVEDDGPGLDKDPQDLLRPFVTTKQKGTGLGLPVVARIAEMHRGELTIGPRDGGGTRAQIRLPRRLAGTR